MSMTWKRMPSPGAHAADESAAASAASTRTAAGARDGPDAIDTVGPLEVTARQGTSFPSRPPLFLG